MRISCPLCGERDLREFHYLGSAKLLTRPKPKDITDPSNVEDQAAFHDYVHIRENIEGKNAELWLHEFGCRAWLHVVRDTKTHKIEAVKMARDHKGAK